jgi:hypothetical protein
VSEVFPLCVWFAAAVTSSQVIPLGPSADVAASPGGRFYSVYPVGMNDGLCYPLVEREHEPEFDYIDHASWGFGVIATSRGRCNHANVVPVVSLGDHVADLCIDCDAQLPSWRV